MRLQTPSTEFLGRLQRRIDAGFLAGKRHWRSRYAVTRHTDRELTFRASDFMTAINVGINHVEVQLREDSRLEYVVTYRRWAAYCAALGALIGMLGVGGFLLFPDIRADVDRGGPGIFWGMVAFWGFVWPWLLIALHKPFAKRCLNRVFAEVDRQPA